MHTVILSNPVTTVVLLPINSIGSHSSLCPYPSVKHEGSMDDAGKHGHTLARVALDCQFT